MVNGRTPVIQHSFGRIIDVRKECDDSKRRSIDGSNGMVVVQTVCFDSVWSEVAKLAGPTEIRRIWPIVKAELKVVEVRVVTKAHPDLASAAGMLAREMRN